MKIWAKIGAVAFLILAAWLSVAWIKSTPRPNIILISIDTLRADHFTPEHMPRTYAWAEKNAMIYTNAHSAATWTRPSHCSMLTGLLPSHHRVETGNQKLHLSLTTVAEELKAQKYHTVAFVGGAQVSTEWHMQQGFDAWKEAKYRQLQSSNISLREIKDGHYEPIQWARKWLSATDEKRPYFLFVHTFGLHEYWMESRPDLSPELPWRDVHGDWSDADADTRYRAYCAAVRECDERLALLLDVIPSDVILILTSDHGEGFAVLGEEPLHRNQPTPDQTHVPLVVQGFGVGITDGLVSNVDIPRVLTQRTPFPLRASIVAECVDYDHVTRFIAQIEPQFRHIRKEIVSLDDNAPISPETAEKLHALGYLH